MNIEIQGQRELLQNLSRFKNDAVGKAMDEGLKAAGMDIIADAKTNLRSNTSVVTGQLRASGKVQKLNEGSYEVGFFSEGKGYAEYVEYGVRKKWKPPYSYLKQWAHKKFGVNDQEAGRIAYIVRMTIAGENPRKQGQFGTKPHPFFAPAVSKHKKAIISTIADAINKTIKEYSK